jgi:single-stranded-DNA-specific exonuclease
MQLTHWNILQPPQDVVHELSARLDITVTLAAILANRGIRTAREGDRFLNPSLEHLHDPFSMLGMEKAVSLLGAALSRQEQILVFGDYDVDGVTGTALLAGYLRRFTDQVSYYIPHRVEEGYGLQSERLRRFADDGGKLVLSVDCGISHVSEVEEGRSLGLTFILTDHHEPPSTLPPADAILNPRQPRCSYPFKHLAGVGIAFKLIQGLDRPLRGSVPVPGPAGAFSVFDFLDLVALGTVADIVPLQDENRILVNHGMKSLNRASRTGVKALKVAAGLASRTLTTSHISFALGPRINAAGRLGRADGAVKLLLEEDPSTASALAESLNLENRRRQQIEALILQEAAPMIDSDPSLLEDSFLVLSSPRWHSGVIGIVASKLAERHDRPTVLISTKDDPGKGSARSVPGFDLYSSLQRCRHLLESFGGHSYAAGLSIRKDRIGSLRHSLNLVGRPEGRALGERPVLDVDARVAFDKLRSPFLKELRRLMPFGNTNPPPTFITEGVYLGKSPRVVGNNHLRLSLSQKPFVLQAIGFNLGNLASSFCRDLSFNVAYSLDLDPSPRANGHQLSLCDVQFPYSFEPPCEAF